MTCKAGLSNNHELLRKIRIPSGNVCKYHVLKQHQMKAKKLLDTQCSID